MKQSLSAARTHGGRGRPVFVRWPDGSRPMPKVMREVGGIGLPPAALGGCKITTLANGRHFLPDMLDAVGSIWHSIAIPDYSPAFAVPPSANRTTDFKPPKGGTTNCHE